MLISKYITIPAYSFSKLNILQQTQQNTPKMAKCSYFYFRLSIPIVNNSIKYKTSFQSYLEMCYINAAYFPSYFFPSISPASKNNASDAALFTVLVPTCTPIMFRAQLGHIAFTGILCVCVYVCVCPFLPAHVAFFKMKLNGPEEILFCHGNENITNHFSPLISIVALGDIFGN